jgi:hypothetical protein
VIPQDGEPRIVSGRGDHRRPDSNRAPSASGLGSELPTPHVIVRRSCRLKNWRPIASRFDHNLKNVVGVISPPHPSSGGCGDSAPSFPRGPPPVRLGCHGKGGKVTLQRCGEMPMLIALLMVVLSPPAQADEPPPQADIIVTAVRNDCRVRFADRELTDREFNEHARDWSAGKTVRVFARSDADIKCLSKIAFKLADRGIRSIEFVNPAGKTSTPPISSLAASAQPSATAQRTPVQDAERRFFARRAAQLILNGKCAEARRMTLEGGDLESAAYIAEICRGQ